MIVLTREYLAGKRARTIPGAYFDRGERAWVLKDPTPRAATLALQMFPVLAAAYPELSELRAKLAQQVRPVDYARQYDKPIGAVRCREVLRSEGHDLYEFQSIDAGYIAAVLRQHGGAYIGHERGLGKTLSTCAIIDDLDCHRTLVVAPNTAKQAVWRPEVERFCPWLEVVVVRNTKGQREKDLEYVRALDKPCCVIVHYEALDIVAGKNGRGWDKFGTWDLIVADEAHRIANPKTKMARALKKIPAKAKLALSGSIIMNHAEELFSPLQWLYPANYKSKWRDWNDRYLDYVDDGYSKICIGVKIEQLDAMRDELGRIMVYRRSEDELDLPDRTEQTLHVDLSVGQRKVYEGLFESGFAELPDGQMVKAIDALALLGRLRQIASGLDLVGEVADSTKLDLAVDLIKDSDDPFVVFGWYKASLRALEDRLDKANIECYRVDGDVPQAQRAQYIREFQAGNGRVFMGTLKTLAESVTLHRANQVIFLDRSWNPSDNLQARDRVYRIGQTRPVTITDIVARDTVDELRVTPVVQSKLELRKLVLGA